MFGKIQVRTKVTTLISQKRRLCSYLGDFGELWGALTSDDKSSKEKVEVYDSSATVRECIGCVDKRKSVNRRASSTRLVSRFELEKHVLTCVTGRPGTMRPTASVKVQSRIERRGRVYACLRE